ncbi:hypothetical protein [Pseudonocardia sp. NPDC046786]|uniref:hypothetical protein n=1 Tax=Pseudonocardia sp. NPDC046786 TaxID=3155471 RepID=UPI0033F65B1F
MTASTSSGTVVVDYSGVRIGIADERSDVRDFGGVRIGSVGDDGVVRDPGNVVLGHVEGR